MTDALVDPRPYATDARGSEWLPTVVWRILHVLSEGCGFSIVVTTPRPARRIGTAFASYIGRYPLTVSAAAFLPAIRPCTAHLARPCRLNPPADSPPH